MVARKDLTPETMSRLRQCSEQGQSKTQAAETIGVNPYWITKTARRMGLIDEINRLFPPNIQTLRKFALDEVSAERVRRMTASGIGVVDISERLGTNRARLADAIKDAGMVEEISRLRRQARNRLKREGPIYPRDLDPAVQWLTRAWRVAA